MIFVTVGTQLGFNRLIHTVTESVPADTDIFFQIGHSTISTHFKNSRFLTGAQYSEIISKTSLIIGHAGMGTIITALEHQIPCIIMPRRKHLNEHRNDHQLDTCHKFKNSYGILVL